MKLCCSGVSEAKGTSVGIFFFFVKVAVVIALIAGVFWVVSRFRN